MGAPTTVTYGGLNLNDGVTYSLLDGFDPGERTKTWSEYSSYSGSVAQLNVDESAYVQMSFRLLVTGQDHFALRSAVKALNDLIDAGDQNFVWNDGGGAVTYSCVSSPRVHYAHTGFSQEKYSTVLNVVLYREP